MSNFRHNKMEDPKATAQLVKEEINSSLFLKEVLKDGLINYSSLARKILPRIKIKNPKANFASVLIAVQRYYDEIEKKSPDNLSTIIKDSELIMKNKIVSFTLERTKKAINLINEISKEIRWDLGDILFFVQGSGEITAIIDKKNKDKFEVIKKEIIEKKENLATLSIRESESFGIYSKDVKGYLALLTATLADNNINIIDIASTYKQIIFVIDEKDLVKAYEALNKIIKRA